jgi:NAD(P)-dependent dehydrogenase (short-subunit alcohol dehydrogenase family)
VPVRFAGQVAIVTSGALGIGGGISRRLAKAGAHVVLYDVDADAASATSETVTSWRRSLKPRSPFMIRASTSW